MSQRLYWHLDFKRSERSYMCSCFQHCLILVILRGINISPFFLALCFFRDRCESLATEQVQDLSWFYILLCLSEVKPFQFLHCNKLQTNLWLNLWLILKSQSNGFFAFNYHSINGNRDCPSTLLAKLSQIVEAVLSCLELLCLFDLPA